MIGMDVEEYNNKEFSESLAIPPPTLSVALHDKPRFDCEDD